MIIATLLKEKFSNSFRVSLCNVRVWVEPRFFESYEDESANSNRPETCITNHLIHFF